MKLLRMDNVSIIVKDLPRMIAFFEALGMVLEGQAPVEEAWAGRLCGIPGMKVDIAMLKTPDGLHRVELSRFRQPAVLNGVPDDAPVNTLGLRRLMFSVEDIDAMAAHLRAHGAE
jgi:catechol 2,3-dioxygenase-like lactoylglutathione lyase family enzyme